MGLPPEQRKGKSGKRFFGVRVTGLDRGLVAAELGGRVRVGHAVRPRWRSRCVPRWQHGWRERPIRPRR